MSNKQYELTDSFKDSISPAKDIAIDFGELLLDSTMDESLLKQIPILSTAINLYSFSSKLLYHIELMKLLAFIKRVSENIDTETEKDKLLEKINKDKKKYNESLQQMIYILSQYSNTEKADILGRFYVAFLKGWIDIEKLQMYADLINQLMPNELKYMIREIYGAKYTADIKFGYKAASVRRLVALGLCYEEITAQSSPLMDHGVEVSISRYLHLTAFGNTFFRIAAGK